MRTSLVSSLVLAACSLTAASALAASTVPDRVELSSQRLAQANTALVAACPGLHDHLPDALVRAHPRAGLGQTVQVAFTLQGTRITDVVASDIVASGEVASAGAPHTQRAVRWAVQALECNGTSSAAQRYTLNIRFVDPSDTAATRALALVDVAAVDAGQ